MAPYQTIPTLLRKYRKIRGLKQKEVALILGHKSASRLCRWERGACLPNVMNVLKLSVVYRVLVDAMFIDHVRRFRSELLEREEKLIRYPKPVHHV